MRSDLGPIYVYPAYDGETDTTTWHGYVLTPAVRLCTQKPTCDAVVEQLIRVVRRDTAERGPVQVVERHWRKGRAPGDGAGGAAAGARMATAAWVESWIERAEDSAVARGEDEAPHTAEDFHARLHQGLEALAEGAALRQWLLERTDAGRRAAGEGAGE